MGAADALPVSPADGVVSAWAPPSFDPPPPPVPPPPAPSVEEIEALVERARAEGHAEGRAAGFAEGRAEGLAQGLAEGRERGHREAFDAARARLEAATASLQTVLDEIAGFPDALAEPVVDLALLVAQRLSGSQAFERAAFVQAVQEALMHLPQPGEQLRLRVGPADADSWREAIHRYELPFGHAVVVDADVQPGRAFVEVGGTRLDVGAAARRALVRTALGLPPSP